MLQCLMVTGAKYRPLGLGLIIHCCFALMQTPMEKPRFIFCAFYYVWPDNMPTGRLYLWQAYLVRGEGDVVKGKKGRGLGLWSDFFAEVYSSDLQCVYLSQPPYDSSAISFSTPSGAQAYSSSTVFAVDSSVCTQAHQQTLTRYPFYRWVGGRNMYGTGLRFEPATCRLGTSGRRTCDLCHF